jgi:prepilin-type N-terminal cleavage/methylation domain-containing protein
MIYGISSRPPTRGNRGFTLLEVLVSLTIMAIITGVAFAGLSIGVDSWRRGTRKINDLDRRFVLERLVQRQIAFADNIFRGDVYQLEFSTTYSVANGPGDAVWVKYVIGPDNWMYSEVPLSQYVTDAPVPAVTQTFTATSTNGFKYLYDVPGNQRDWFNEPMKDNPLAVRVDISGEVLTIPLMNTQSTNTSSSPFIFR